MSDEGVDPGFSSSSPACVIPLNIATYGSLSQADNPLNRGESEIPGSPPACVPQLVMTQTTPSAASSLMALVLLDEGPPTRRSQKESRSFRGVGCAIKSERTTTP